MAFASDTISARQPRDRDGFEIAIVCALPREANAVLEMFDIEWAKQGVKYTSAAGDDNTYTFGAIGQHNVVLSHMPEMGSVSASAVAANLRSSFPQLKLALVVGICGGVPTSTEAGDVHLGDLIISTGMVQYDYGRQYNATFERRDTLEDNHGRPNQKIRGVTAKLKMKRFQRSMQEEIMAYVRDMQQHDPDLEYPGIEKDILYDPAYLHKHRDVAAGSICNKCSADSDVCSEARKMRCEELGCDQQKTIARGRAPQRVIDGIVEHRPAIHFGRIGCANFVLKSGAIRDELAKKDKIIAFEMEGVGVWDNLPTLVVKGVCDYADSHKNKDWQDYAAAIAAAGMKALLKEWQPSEPTTLPGESIGGFVPPQTPTVPTNMFNNQGATIGTQIATQNVGGSIYHTRRSPGR